MPSIDWAGGYSAEWRLMRVNPATWDDVDEVSNVKSAKINRDCSDDVSLLEAGTFTVDLDVGEEFEEGWYRLVMVAVQDGVTVRESIATMTLSGNSGSINRGYSAVDVTGTSVLQPAKDRKLLVGTYAPKGCDGSEYAASLLRDCTPAPVVVDGSFTLDRHVVFGTGVSYLQAAWSILDSAGWCMRISGEGVVTIQDRPSVPIFTLDGENARYVSPDQDYDLDLSDIPNVYYAISGEATGTAVNEDSGRTSVAARGRRVEYVDTNPITVNGETLTAYAKRQLEDLSTVVEKHSYTREYVPGAFPFDIIEASLPEVGMEGYFRILTQALTCDHGLSVDECVGLEIKEYEA